MAPEKTTSCPRFILKFNPLTISHIHIIFAIYSNKKNKLVGYSVINMPNFVSTIIEVDLSLSFMAYERISSMKLILQYSVIKYTLTIK